MGLGGEEALLLAEFPLSLTQAPGVMVPVTLGGKTYTFMLDTGATHTVVDESLRPLLGERIKQVEAETSVNATAQTDLYPPLAAAMVGPLSLKDCGPVMVSDFQPAREQTGAACDGVLGMSFIGKYLWTMDWDFQKLGVYESLASPEKRQTQAAVKPTVPRFSLHLPEGKVSAILDTGYTAALGLEEARFDALERSGAIFNVHRIDLATGVGTREVKLGLVREFKFPRGEQVDVFRNVMVTGSNRTRLGLNFLKAYSVIWDVPADTLLLIPRSWMRELLAEKGLPYIPPPPGVPEPEVAPLPPKAGTGQ